MNRIIYDAIKKEAVVVEEPDVEMSALQTTEPTLEERVAQVETETVTLKTKTVTLEQTLDVLFGGTV